MAQNFIQLAFARLGVGVGEAGGVAPAYSIIADYYPSEKRARALSIYSLGIPIGASMGILGGALLAEYVGWRTAFITVGIAGIAVAPLFKLTVKEPPRGQFDGRTANVKPASIGEVLRTISRKPSFWTMSLGAACSSMMGYGLLFWLPSFFSRSFGDALPGFFTWLPGWAVPNEPSPLLFAGYFFGGIVLVGGMAGIWLGGVLGDKFGAKHKGAYALVPAIAFTITIPLCLVGLLVDSLPVVFLAFLIVQALSVVWLGPVVAAFQHLVGPNMRSTASAIFLFINNLVGIGLGTWLLGVISDYFRETYAEDSLRYSLLSGVALYALAALLLYVTAPRLKHDWQR